MKLLDVKSPPVEQASTVTPPEGGPLGEWLARIVREINAALKRIFDWARFIESDPDPLPQYALETAVLENFTFAAYGGLRARDQNATNNLTALPIPLAFTDGTVTTPRGTVQDPANDRIQIIEDGVYMFGFTVMLRHDSSNSGRTFSLALYDETGGAFVGQGIPVGVGRNVTSTSFSTRYLV